MPPSFEPLSRIPKYYGVRESDFFSYYDTKISDLVLDLIKNKVRKIINNS
jgi:hypothetical protein